MQRRRFIEGVSIATFGMAAGCTDRIGGVIGGDEGPDLETPDFEVNRDAPARPIALTGSVTSEEVSYGDSFSADVMIGNAGGEVVEQETELTFLLEHRDGGSVETQERTVVVGGIGPGETKVVSVGPYDADASGEWAVVPGQEFDRTHAEYDVPVQIDPVVVDAGEELQLDEGLEMTVETVEFEQAVHYDTSESRGYWSSEEVVALHSSLDDQVLAVVRITVENAGSQTIAFDGGGWGYSGVEIHPSQFRVSPNGVFDSLGSEPVGDAKIEGQELRNVRIDPGESVDAWLLSPVGVDELGELSFEFSVRAGETPPEYVVPLDGADVQLPVFEFVEADLPDRRRDEEQELGVVVENTGEGSGTFRGVLEYLDGETWYTVTPPLEVEVEPGESGRAVTTTPEKGTYDYRVQPFGDEFVF